MPNGLAYLALLAWPLVTVALFRSLSVERAVIWSILGGYLLLPPIVAFDFPMIPPLDKFSISNLSAYAACVVLLGQRVPLLPSSTIGRALMVLFVVSPVLTVLTNQDPLYFPLDHRAGPAHARLRSRRSPRRRSPSFPSFSPGGFSRPRRRSARS